MFVWLVIQQIAGKDLFIGDKEEVDFGKKANMC